MPTPTPAPAPNPAPAPTPTPVRSQADAVTRSYIMQQTMLRVKDPVKSLRFYCEVLGFHLVMHRDFPQVPAAHRAALLRPRPIDRLVRARPG